ncbi:unnamed protein product [Owenia fusiformis]|uniref:WSC domain-containing protein n=1 Tax=Owenia fusiformis TaxID=6347 RepID=A0A8S4Q8A5_OWEFU|nr:unnamed protein product [Owenia fusiformis]
MADLMIIMVLLSVLISYCESVGNAASFTVWPIGSYINGPGIIASFSTREIDECLLHCVANSNCVATNVDTTNDMCELLSAIDCNNQGSQNGDWRVLHKEGEYACVVYEYKGCYLDDPTTRDFDQMAYQGDPANTPNKCANTCADSGYSYMGLQDMDECWCGNSYGLNGAAALDSHCWRNCTGDPAYKCGSAFKNSVYQLVDYRTP